MFFYYFAEMLRNTSSSQRTWFLYLHTNDPWLPPSTTSRPLSPLLLLLAVKPWVVPMALGSKASSDPMLTLEPPPSTPAPVLGRALQTKRGVAGLAATWKSLLRSVWERIPHFPCVYVATGSLACALQHQCYDPWHTVLLLKCPSAVEYTLAQSITV